VDPLIGFDRDMLISEIEYGLSEERGTITSMTVAPPEGFMPDPPEPERRAKKAKGKKGDAFEYLLPPNWEK
jgi:prophage tail gpP-like protein